MPVDLFDVVQQFQIDELRELSRQTETRIINDTRPYAERIARQIGALTLINRAMWELLEAKLGVTQAELVAKVAEIDLRDGVADGQYMNAAGDCPECEAKICVQLQRCLFCGFEPKKKDPFDAVTDR